MTPNPPPPKIDHLAVLHEALTAAREEVVTLCETLVDTDLLSSWQVAPAVTAWHQAAEAWNAAVADAAALVRSFMKEHTEDWLASARGQAYAAWAEALDNAEVATEPTDTLRLSLSINLASGQVEGMVANAEEVLPKTPDLPALDA